MSTARLFCSTDFFQPTDDEPIRSVITQSPEATVVAWYIKQGQKIPPHIHPHGQDTWTIIAGQGHYYLDNQGNSRPITAGDIVVAHTGEIHGVFNDAPEPLLFISVVSPADAGYQPV